MRRIVLAVLVPCTIVYLFSCSGAQQEEKSAAQAQQADQEARGVPEGINPKQTSDDPTYGYTRDNPIKIGAAEGFSGPSAERLYLRHLRDSKFRPFAFERLGSFNAGPEGHILDGYKLTDQDGNTFTLYIDMYHGEVHLFHAKAPKGMHFWKQKTN